MIDLHTHTKHSDGSSTTEELLKEAERGAIITKKKWENINSQNEVEYYKNPNKIEPKILIEGRHTEKIKSDRCSNNTTPNQRMHLFSEKKTCDGHHYHVHRRNKSAFSCARPHSNTELLQICRNEHDRSAKERSGQKCFFLRFGRSRGENFSLPPNQDHGNEKECAQHHSHSVEGKGADGITCQILSHEGSSPEKGGKE